MRRSLIFILMLSFAAAALTACGKRGVLEAPPSEPTERSVEPKPNEKPYRPFVLDPLLR
jgi:predicted small lipoprotein YifL